MLTPLAITSSQHLVVSTCTRQFWFRYTAFARGGKPGIGMNIGLYKCSAVMDALYQRAITVAYSIARRDASEKSAGQRIRVIGAMRCFNLRGTIDACSAEDANVNTIRHLPGK